MLNGKRAPVKGKHPQKIFLKLAAVTKHLLFRLCIVIVLSQLLFIRLELVAQISLEWTNTYKFSEQGQTPLSFTLDDSGNVIIVGRDYTQSWYDNVYLLKINTNGVTTWETILIDTIGAHNVSKVICDKFGNSYVSLYPEDFYFNDVPYVSKISSTGDFMWIDTTETFGESLLLDSQNNLFCLFSDFGVHIKKYDESGNTIWDMVNDTFSNATNVIETLLVSDIAGNLYVGGDNNNDFIEDGFNLKKFSSDGHFIWQTDYNPSIEDDNLYHMAADPMGNIVLAGNVAHGDSGIAIVKVNANGAIEWDTLFSIWDSFPLDLKVDEDGNVIIYGTYRDYGSLDCYYFVSKLNPIGEVLWNHITDSVYLPRRVGSLAIDTSNNVYFNGCIVSSYDQTLDIYMSKLSENGNMLWKEQYDEIESATPLGLDIDYQNNIYTVGYGRDSLSLNYEIITLKYSQIVTVPEIYFQSAILQVFPNPFHTSSTLQLPKEVQSMPQLELRIFDMPGREIRRESVPAASTYQLQSNGLPAGMYLIKLISEGKALVSSKVIIE